MMTFASPITQIYHSLFVQNPSETFNYMAYIEPMHWIAWAGLIGWCLVAPPFLFLPCRFPERDDNYHEFTLPKSYVYQLSTLTMRGWDILPERISPRVSLFSLLGLGTLIYLHWEAMLISTLSTRVIVLPFQNIPELVSATPFRISLNPGSSYEDAFKTSRDPDWMVAWTERIEPHLADYTGRTTRLVQLIQDESTTALYDNYFAVM